MGSNSFRIWFILQIQTVETFGHEASQEEQLWTKSEKDVRVKWEGKVDLNTSWFIRITKNRGRGSIDKRILGRRRAGWDYVFRLKIIILSSRTLSAIILRLPNINWAIILTPRIENIFHYKRLNHTAQSHSRIISLTPKITLTIIIKFIKLWD